MSQDRADPTLDTERLHLRPLALEDASALHPMFGDAETMRFMPSTPHAGVDGTRAYLEHELASPGSLHWAICLKETAQPIGHINYLGQTRVPGLGYILRRDYWGRGLTTEACRAVLAYGFDKLGLDRVELWIDDRNLASQRVAAKLGFGVKGQIPLRYSHESHHHSMIVYGLWADEWAGQSHTHVEARFFGVEPVLIVPDITQTVAYYREKLGFRVDFLFGDPPNHAGVSRGDWTGRVVSLQFSQGELDSQARPTGYLYIMVDAEIDRLHTAYRTNGVEIVTEPTTQPWGMREFTVRDLNGHLLRFGTRA